MAFDSAWMALTRFGNSGLMLPAAGIVAAWLFVGRTRHAAGWSLALFVLAAGLVGASKIAFYGWGVGIRAVDFAGFSGHAMLASAVFPVAAYLFLPARLPRLRLAGAALGFAMGMAVGVSRVMVGAHSSSEAIAGCVLGALVALAVMRLSSDHRRVDKRRVNDGGANTGGALHGDRRRSSARMQAWSAVPVLALLLLFAFGRPLNLDEYIVRLALVLSGHAQPVAREAWLAGGG